MTVFVHSDYLLARVHSQDRYHKRAVQAAKGSLEYVTSAVAIDDVLATMVATGHADAACHFLSEMRNQDRIRIVHADAPLQAEAWAMFDRWSRHGVGPVACMSFAIMRRLAIKRAFTFDHQFKTAGFEILS